MPLSDEQRAKISAALKGRPKSEEHRRRIGESQRGIPKSNAHRLALSEAQYRRHARLREERNARRDT